MNDRDTCIRRETSLTRAQALETIKNELANKATCSNWSRKDFAYQTASSVQNRGRTKEISNMSAFQLFNKAD